MKRGQTFTDSPKTYYIILSWSVKIIERYIIFFNYLVYTFISVKGKHDPHISFSEPFLTTHLLHSYVTGLKNKFNTYIMWF